MDNQIFEPGMGLAPLLDGDTPQLTTTSIIEQLWWLNAQAPVDATVLFGSDRKFTWGVTKATLKTYFDGLYAPVSHSHTIAAISGLQTSLDAKVSTSSLDMTGAPYSVAQVNPSGDLTARLFRSSYASANGTVNFIMTQIDQESNNYIRPSTPAQVGVALRPYLVERNGGDSFSLHCNMSLEGIYWYNAAKSAVYPICTSYNWSTFASLMAGSGPVYDRIENRAAAHAESRASAYYNLAMGNIMPTIAAQGVGGIGTYALLKVNPNVQVNPGAGVSGSDCTYSSAAGAVTGGNASGSWRCMGSAPATTGIADYSIRTTLFLRYA